MTESAVLYPRLEGLVPERIAWRGPDMLKRSDWIYPLNARQIAELDNALMKVRDKPVTEIRRADFPLPTFSEDLAGLADEIENGRGFVLMRGLPIDKYSEEDGSRIYWGMGMHLGDPVSQNKFGHLLGHVRDEGYKYGEKNTRGYYTNAKLLFHCDNADVVGLLCYRQAKSGGLSSITSSMAIYNEFVKRRPELLDQLYEGFYYDLRGEERPGLPEVTPHRLPTFSYFAGKLSCRYVRNAIRLAQAKMNRTLNERELATLDFFDEMSHSPELRLDMDFEPGDIQLLNNHTIVHARTEFEDWPEPERRRHLLRLWLNLHIGRPLEEKFAERYGPNGGRLGVPV